jgi:hypothetical protein
MARFLGSIKGSRGRATRLGTPASGIEVSAQGWSAGVTVYGSPDGDYSDQDQFEVWATGGSSGIARRRLICTIVETADGYSVLYPGN